MNNKSNKGFSLVELLVAIAVMSIILVMVVQMMGNSSVALRKTRKKLELQTEAMEFREQFSDILMQANYIRVMSADKVTYTLDTGIDSTNKNKRKRDVTAVGTVTGSLVSENYPNQTAPGDANLDIYMNQGTYTLYGKDRSGTQYPVSIDPMIQSMRILTDGAPLGQSYYIIPSYIYVRYQRDETNNTEQYAMFHFVKDGDSYKVFVDKGTINNIDTSVVDGFFTAKSYVDSKAGINGLMSDKVKDVYFSADVAANTVYVDIQFENAKYINQTYEYRDAISLRNTYALSVPPNKMYMKETVTP